MLAMGPSRRVEMTSLEETSVDETMPCRNRFFDRKYVRKRMYRGISYEADDTLLDWLVGTLVDRAVLVQREGSSLGTEEFERSARSGV